MDFFQSRISNCSSPPSLLGPITHACCFIGSPYLVAQSENQAENYVLPVARGSFVPFPPEFLNMPIFGWDGWELRSSS
ncbi:hypothetical protein RvY_07034 [Ramazzottius varieornatus]|uniref:Uncharacterized protein n=1 Tax=Ramazzottius varieornatus TaxID=947166 RepID=A0A1D1V5W1_RAMVA|nr:hypothetical protein RvY_07034 [Ramazzottius varieornatus]